MESIKVLRQKTVLQLYKEVFPVLRNEKTSLFLIGASTKDLTSLRNKLRIELEKSSYFDKRFDIYYPEDIFTDLLYSGKTDLLTLENLLAKSVHVVVICLESQGSIAELGVFVNHPSLYKKLVVVVDDRFRKANSFIRKGPIKFLEKANPNPIIWYDFKNGVIEDLTKKTRTTINKVAKNNTVSKDLTNIIVAEDFILLVIYTLGPLSEQDLISYIKNMKSLDINEAETICKSVLGKLFKIKEVFLETNEYSLTKKGLGRLLNSLPQKNRCNIMETIDELRVTYLNCFLRKC